MGRLLLKVFIVLFLLLGLGTSATLGYLYVKLRQDRDLLVNQTDDLNKRVRLLQKKYADEKGRTAGLARTKLTLEGEIRAAQEDIVSLKKDNEFLLGEKEALNKKIKQMEKGGVALKGEIELLSGRYEKLREECTETRRTLTQRVKDLDAEKTQLTAEGEALRLELDRTNRHLARCESNNAQLCVIAEELVESYENKGVVGSVFQKEPFLQFKKVEIEKFAQEYREKIDEQQLRTME